MLPGHDSVQDWHLHMLTDLKGLPIDLSGDAPDDEENPRPTQIDGEPKEPQKKFPFTTDMTYYFGQLLANTQQMVELNRKAG